jgi:imidazole glycerol-phosphate synthase subunit HisF
MLAKRIIPCLDIKDGRVVKGVNFVNIIDAGDPVELACLYDKEGADELVFLDITASSEKRNTVIDLVKRVANNVFIPFTVGGGIRTLEDIRDMLLAGADKVSINTASLKNPEIISLGSKKFGSQCIVIAIDARRRNNLELPEVQPEKHNIDCACNQDSKYEVIIHGGRTRTGVDAIKWATKVQKLGAGEILLTSMDADGTQKGYDLEMTKEISSILEIPVIASGGAGSIDQIAEALAICEAGLLASLLHYRKLTIPEIKTELKEKNIPIRSIIQ